MGIIDISLDHLNFISQKYTKLVGKKHVDSHAHLELVRILRTWSCITRAFEAPNSSSAVSWAFSAVRAHNSRLSRWHRPDGGALIFIVSMRLTMGLNGCPTPTPTLGPTVCWIWFQSGQKRSKSEMPVYVIGRRLLSRWWRPGISGLASKWVRFAPNETNPCHFQIRCQYTLATRAILKLIFKKSEISPIKGQYDPDWSSTWRPWGRHYTQEEITTPGRRARMSDCHVMWPDWCRSLNW